MRTRILASALAVTALTQCYAAEFDPTVSGVFYCESDADCTLGQRCGDGICRAVGEAFGPTLEITDPPLLQVFPQGGASSFQVDISGTDLALTNELDMVDDPYAGYLQVFVDGALATGVTEGALEDGVTIGNLPMPTQPGLHHVVVKAYHVDGDRFDNPESEAHTAFWVDDGREHVGILTPAPAAELDLQEPSVSVEVAALNFTFVNPGYVNQNDTDANQRAGYVRLYVDANVPTCLPSCNINYQAAFLPPGLSRVNRMTAENALILPEGIGTIRLQIVAQSTLNTPYSRDSLDGEFVYYELPVQSVVGSTQ